MGIVVSETCSAYKKYNKISEIQFVFLFFSYQAAGYILQPGHYSSLTAPNLQPTANEERDDQCGNQHCSHELLMIGIVVPETCCSYKKYNKKISSISLVLILQVFSNIKRFLKHKDYIPFVADVRKMNAGVKILIEESENTQECHYTQFRYLGLLLDSKLLFTRHLISVIHKATGIFLQIFPLLAHDSTLSIPNKLTLYKLCIRSILTHAALFGAIHHPTIIADYKFHSPNVSAPLATTPGAPPYHVFIPP